MRVSFFSGLAVVALLASSAMAVQLDCPCNDLPQPMEVAQIHQSTTSSSKSSSTKSSSSKTTPQTGSSTTTPAAGASTTAQAGTAAN